MGIASNYLPDNSSFIQHAFDHAMDTVNDDIDQAGSQTTSWSPYELAVYNLGGHLLVKFASDQTYPLSALSWSSGTVTATTVSPHAILPGDSVSLFAVSPLAYGGPSTLKYVVVQAVPDTSHFQYALQPNPGAATLLTGASASEMLFTNLRKQFKMNSFVPGVVGNTSDVSTSVGLVNPDFMRGFTLENLDLLKTPYGQNYLAIAQKYGPALWGLTC